MPFELLTIRSFAYYQMGSDANATDTTGNAKKINAFDISMELNYKLADWINVTIGGEVLSGTSQDPSKRKEQRSSNPLYGTNHRFNGYLDYFYVGNHLNNVGLVDTYLKFNFTKNNWSIFLNLHNFRSAAEIMDVTKTSSNQFVAMNKQLGKEIDVTLLHKIAESVSIQIGYSQIWGTQSLATLKGSSYPPTINNWGYVMLLIRPGIIFPRSGLKQ